MLNQSRNPRGFGADDKPRCPNCGELTFLTRRAPAAHFHQTSPGTRPWSLTPRRRPHTPPSGINYALKLLLAFETRECLSLVLGSVFGVGVP